MTPVTQSAKKALRRDKRRTLVNLRIKKKMKIAIKSARERPTKKNLTLAYSLLDRAVKKNLIHPNKAARLKSQLAKKTVKKSPPLR